MDISLHLHQTAEYRPAIGNCMNQNAMDDRGQLRHGDCRKIPCRKRYKLTETLTADAQIIKGEWIYRLDMPIRVDDMLDDRRVLFVQEMVTPGGNVYGYKAVC